MGAARGGSDGRSTARRGAWSAEAEAAAAPQQAAFSRKLSMMLLLAGLTLTSGNCPPGQWQELAAQAACKVCPEGKYVSAATNPKLACEACAAGRFAPTSTGGAGACTACPAGKWQDAANATSCKACGDSKGTRAAAQISGTSCIDAADSECQPSATSCVTSTNILVYDGYQYRTLAGAALDDSSNGPNPNPEHSLMDMPLGFEVSPDDQGSNGILLNVIGAHRFGCKRMCTFNTCYKGKAYGNGEDDPESEGRQWTESGGQYRIAYTGSYGNFYKYRLLLRKACDGAIGGVGVLPQDVCAASARRKSITSCATLATDIASQAVPTTYVLGAGTLTCGAGDFGEGSKGVTIGIGKIVVIEGAGQDSTTINLNQQGRMFKIQGGAVALGSLTVRDGKDTTGTGGGLVIIAADAQGGGAFEANLVTIRGCESNGKGGVVHASGGTFTSAQCTM